MKYKIKDIEATQWFKNGDHPNDECVIRGNTLSEGKVVRYFRSPVVPGRTKCSLCNHKYHDHGWIEKNSITICPGDYIVWFMGAYGKLGQKEFEDTFERVT